MGRKRRRFMPGQAIVIIKDKQWSVAVANTYAELISGLSGVSSLSPQTGMLFDLGYDQKYIEIDMTRMLFPLDIVFINSTQGVVGVMHNVQPGLTDVRLENEQLPGARCFLEINAGEAEGIEAGDSVNIQGYTQPAQFNVNTLINFMGIAMILFMMMRVVGQALEEPTPILLPQAKSAEYEFKPGEIVIYKGERVRVSEQIGDRVNIFIPSRQELVWVKPEALEKMTEGKPQTTSNYDKELTQLRRDFREGAISEENYMRAVKEILARKHKPYQSDVSATKRYEFFPEEVRKLLPPIGSTGEERDPMVWVKFFTPWANWTWYGIEFDGKDIFFGWVVGLEKEFGSFSLSELQSLRGPGDLKIERDIYFKPQRISEVMKLHGEYLATAVIPTKQQGKYVKIIAPGKTYLTIGSVVTREELELENKKARERGEQPATAEVWEGGKPMMIRPKVIPTEKTRAQPDKLEYLADSPEFLTQTIDSTGYRDKLDTTFQEAIRRSKGLK
jgi:uncharacterized membrane protein (UPF0127 family)